MMDGAVIAAGVAEGFYPTSESSVIFGSQAALVDSETRCDRINFGELQPEPIPAVSDWGVVIVTLLVASSGAIVFARARWHGQFLIARAGEGEDTGKQ